MASAIRTESKESTPKGEDYKFIHNRYTRARGTPKMYEIFCSKCETLLLIYQKDGKGQLLRCYYDRIHYPQKLSDKEKLICHHCKIVVGKKMIYKPEDRPAFRMTKGAFLMR